MTAKEMLATLRNQGYTVSLNKEVGKIRLTHQEENKRPSAKVEGVLLRNRDAFLRILEEEGNHS